MHPSLLPQHQLYPSSVNFLLLISLFPIPSSSLSHLSSSPFHIQPQLSSSLLSYPCILPSPFTLLTSLIPLLTSPLWPKEPAGSSLVLPQCRLHPSPVKSRSGRDAVSASASARPLCCVQSSMHRLNNIPMIYRISLCSCVYTCQGKRHVYMDFFNPFHIFLYLLSSYDQCTRVEGVGIRFALYMNMEHPSSACSITSETFHVNITIVSHLSRDVSNYNSCK